MIFTSALKVYKDDVTICHSAHVIQFKLVQFGHIVSCPWMLENRNFVLFQYWDVA